MSIRRTKIGRAGRPIEAQLVDHRDNKVMLKKRDGRTITVPIDKRSAEDREYLTKHTK
jgi:hypothetical protein